MLPHSVILTNSSSACIKFLFTLSQFDLSNFLLSRRRLSAVQVRAPQQLTAGTLEPAGRAEAQLAAARQATEGPTDRVSLTLSRVGTQPTPTADVWQATHAIRSVRVGLHQTSGQTGGRRAVGRRRRDEDVRTSTLTRRAVAQFIATGIFNAEEQSGKVKVIAVKMLSKVGAICSGDSRCSA